VRDFLQLLEAGGHQCVRLHSALLAPAHDALVRPDTLVQADDRPRALLAFAPSAQLRGQLRAPPHPLHVLLVRWCGQILWLSPSLAPCSRARVHICEQTHSHKHSQTRPWSHGQRGPTVLRRGDPKLHARPGGQLELGLRPQRHASGAVSTRNKTGYSRIHRTSMCLCVLLRSARSIFIGNSKLTIKTFLFSPPLSAPPPACTANFCVFFFYRPTGRPRRTSMPLECHRNKTTRTRSGFAACPFI
jgi:hypothetical protein